MDYNYLKSLHIIFVVTWFAGLFYIVRLFVYYAETAQKSEPEKSILQTQFALMQKRLWYGITWPSAVLTVIMGLSLLHYYSPIPTWLWIKLGFVVGLLAYHLYCHRIFKQHQRGEIKQSSTTLRIWNEVATLFLVSIVFLVVLKNGLSATWGVLGFIGLSVLLMAAIMVYKKLRKA
ncbi:CopD family protein [Rufibacter tibetensis]|uniref:Protoporphyrinogen IX oxidase n=1 Tax=Rufibacter tibetensis TaxID=512763 RepID=A0A0P0CAR6_9BACT|nr:CopD family protein [Rufibacter tibetensis]ALI98643.1 protoporphyrinogen IX oxidase [Rufibacter tibetensis]